MSDITTRSKGQVEDLISKNAAAFYAKTLGVGPHETRTYIIEDMVIIRLKGRLLPIEQKLLEGAGGINLVKNIRKTLHEITTKGMNSMIKKITECDVVSSHSDISTKTGERLEVFILKENLEEKLVNNKLR
jgi:uncharacterized protein YbcI